ncbi:hypothetical protein FE257_000544 [Aspergillus nanangensis]|uniref:Transcriptional regulator n=1 Tax=Aspergillus nanangensis TaxID=2582783 RepID=A0AAD4CWE9_ASPNN|nr:hypothetical protein FE257_000544 [Aspergillus nanangensis]
MPPRYALSESGSEPDEPIESTLPSNDVLEKALRDATANIYKSGKMEELTVKRVRLAAEKALELEEGFFKANNTWKSKSDRIIKDEVTEQDKAAQGSGPEEDNEEDEEEDGPVLAPPKKAKLAKRTKPAESLPPRKRQKTSTPETDDDDQSSAPLSDVSDVSEDEVKQPSKRQSKQGSAKRPRPKPAKKGEAVDSDAAEEQDREPSKEGEEHAKVEPNPGSESEMSVVLDEDPKPTRKRQKNTGSSAPKGKKKAPAKGKDADLDPNQAEIKRLKDWLGKCGVRKMWWRELAPFETPKAKIQHLKDMLKDIGMGGRYSLEKARQIREERELQADLEQVQEGAKLWGKDSAGEDSESGRPRRRLHRGSKALAFLESDGEETD